MIDIYFILYEYIFDIIVYDVWVNLVKVVYEYGILILIVGFDNLVG